MPRRSSVEKPAEDVNVEKRVTRGSLRKSEGGSSLAPTPEKQKDTNKSKNQSPAKANSTPGKRGRPSKRSIASTDEDNDKTDIVDNDDNQTTTDIQDGLKETADHETKPTETSKASEDAEHSEMVSEETDKPESNGKKRLADNGDETEGPCSKKPRSEEQTGKEACTEEASKSAVGEISPAEAEKTEISEKQAADKTEKLAAVDATPASIEHESSNKTETADTINHSNDNTGIIPDVCSKIIPSDSTAEANATTDEVIKENGCREAEGSVVASDAC